MLFRSLAEFLNACGARISGHGTSVVRIEGVKSLHGASYRVMPDRIEAGTYLVAAGITGGDLELEDCPVEALETVIDKLRDMGMQFDGDSSLFRAFVDGPLNCVDLSTRPYHPVHYAGPYDSVYRRKAIATMIHQRIKHLGYYESF